MTSQPEAITLDDISAVVNIIDACTTRGAFRGNELLSVATVREKFVAFVSANTPANTPADDPQSNDEDQNDGGGGQQ